jgi:hypothetical protein
LDEQQPLLTKKITLKNTSAKNSYELSLQYFKGKEYHKGWRGYSYSLKIIEQKPSRYITVEYRESGSSDNWGLSPSKDTDSIVEIDLRQDWADVDIEVRMYKRTPYKVFEFGYIDPKIFWVDFVRDYWMGIGINLAGYEEYLYPTDLYVKRLKWEREYVRSIKILYYFIVFLGIILFTYILIYGK